MAWIESHQTLREHPKTYALADALSISTVTVVGHLHFLWWWCLDYAQGGRFRAEETKKIARAAGWMGEAGKFCDAMLYAGFLDKCQDGDVEIHDWFKFAGRLIQARDKDAKRKQDFRRTSGGHPADVQVDGGRTAGVQYSTVPNPTEPKESTFGQKPAGPPPGLDTGGQNGVTSTPPASTPRPQRGGALPPDALALKSDTPRIEAKAISGPKPEPGRGSILTPVQQIVLGFKFRMGVPDEDKAWDRVYFGRFSAPAKGLLLLFGGDVGAALDCLDAVANAHKLKGLTWMPETVLKHASDYKHGRLFK